MLQMNDNFKNNILDLVLVNGNMYEVGIYSGQMPDPNDVGFAIANYSSQKLASALTSSLSIFQRIGSTIRFADIPNRPIAVGTGIATWFAVYYINNNIFNNTSNARCIVGTITDQKDGSGILILEDVNVISGKPVNIIEFGIKTS